MTPFRPKIRHAAAIAVIVAVITGGVWLAWSASRNSERGRDASHTVTSSAIRFAAAAGWRQATTGMHPAAPQPPSATVANVPLQDPPASLPYTTLRHLPTTGVVISASIYVPMRAQAGGNFPTRLLPLRLADADVRHAWETQPNRDVPEYLLLQRVNGFDVDVRVYFGSQQPMSSSVAEAQAELDRLMLPSRE